MYIKRKKHWLRTPVTVEMLDHLFVIRRIVSEEFDVSEACITLSRIKKCTTARVAFVYLLIDLVEMNPQQVSEALEGVHRPNIYSMMNRHFNLVIEDSEYNRRFHKALIRSRTHMEEQAYMKKQEQKELDRASRRTRKPSDEEE